MSQVSQRCPNESSGRDFNGFDICHLVCQYRLMVIASAMSRVKVLNPGRFECVLMSKITVYYESINREIKTKPTYECRCDERLKTRVEESTRLACTQLVGELEHLKIKMRLIDEMFTSVMGEYVFLK